MHRAAGSEGPPPERARGARGEIRFAPRPTEATPPIAGISHVMAVVSLKQHTSTLEFEEDECGFGDFYGKERVFLSA